MLAADCINVCEKCALSEFCPDVCTWFSEERGCAFCLFEVCFAVVLMPFYTLAQACL